MNMNNPGKLNEWMTVNDTGKLNEWVTHTNKMNKWM